MKFYAMLGCWLLVAPVTLLHGGDKPWLIKHQGAVCHFYCAVGGKEQHRAIAAATSIDWKKTFSSESAAKP